MDTSAGAPASRWRASFPLTWTDGTVTDTSGETVSTGWKVRQRVRSLDVIAPDGRTWHVAPLGLSTSRLLSDVDSEHPLHLIRMGRGFGPASGHREIRTDDGDLIGSTRVLGGPRGRRGRSLKLILGEEGRRDIHVDDARFADLTAVLLALGRIDVMPNIRG